MHGELQRNSGKLLNLSANPMDPTHLITELCQHMASLRPVLAAHHGSLARFVHVTLRSAPTASSQHTSSMGLTVGTVPSTRRSMQPCLQYHMLFCHSPSHKLHAPVNTSISPHTSSQQPLPFGGVMWKPPIVKQVLLNQRSPLHLQCPLVSELPSGRCIKISDMPASVITTLAA